MPDKTRRHPARRPQMIAEDAISPMIRAEKQGFERVTPATSAEATSRRLPPNPNFRSVLPKRIKMAAASGRPCSNHLIRNGDVPTPQKKIKKQTGEY
jgi:hypothetical protein